MKEHLEGVAFPPRAMGAAEGQMLRADLVREMVARRERGESTRQIARELAVDRKTVRRWLRIGGWQPRQGGERPRAIDPYLQFIERRGPEVAWKRWQESASSRPPDCLPRSIARPYRACWPYKNIRVTGGKVRRQARRRRKTPGVVKADTLIPPERKTLGSWNRLNHV